MRICVRIIAHHLRIVRIICASLMAQCRAQVGGRKQCWFVSMAQVKLALRCFPFERKLEQTSYTRASPLPPVLSRQRLNANPIRGVILHLQVPAGTVPGGYPDYPDPLFTSRPLNLKTSAFHITTTKSKDNHGSL